MNDPTAISTRETVTAALISELIYELLDAHSDTVELADELTEALEWRAHLQYLTDLQRLGREALARIPTGAIR
jgi:hypothetical protein